MIINKDFGLIISSKRKERRLSQPQLAALMGEHGLDVKAHSISKWEKNVNLPNVMQFFALCEILEITDINKTFQMGNKENLFSRFCLVLSALKTLFTDSSILSFLQSFYSLTQTSHKFPPSLAWSQLTAVS